MTPEEAEKHWQANCLQRLDWLSERVEMSPVDKEYIGFQMKDFLNCFKSALREEIQKEKVKRGQPSEDLEVGKIIGLQIALQLLDSLTPKK